MNTTTSVKVTADSVELAHRQLDRQMELTMERKKTMQEDLGHALADVQYGVCAEAANRMAHQTVKALTKRVMARGAEMPTDKDLEEEFEVHALRNKLEAKMQRKREEMMEDKGKVGAPPTPPQTITPHTITPSPTITPVHTLQQSPTSVLSRLTHCRPPPIETQVASALDKYLKELPGLVAKRLLVEMSEVPDVVSHEASVVNSPGTPKPLPSPVFAWGAKAKTNTPTTASLPGLFAKDEYVAVSDVQVVVQEAPDIILPANLDDMSSVTIPQSLSPLNPDPLLSPGSAWERRYSQEMRDVEALTKDCSTANLTASFTDVPRPFSQFSLPAFAWEEQDVPCEASAGCWAA
ncbi:uncharacterized protein EHS24_008480 [Apiotrichum porosum]|uniref:Uncharacterized protein n=1 Tax=Apiotrichum porosum TaxID=105984 RepID=A0A427XQB7_9TREE|nr:uncharacterized protein EHS24_008480 [Apiotrichum porosum]RSH81046.1 hypothetical protein EHS24_008480 [Apiotrichum porosum]